ncbi:ParB/RepB/Spo0J family partition protein (plasmid) [Tundrisphaera lichenicola]|uniref:ParB/RepB/Spo0J family partition protein n=1 Tax=Tundrisphaera lichenicola TaxID=2029860 RepID=UPI003EBD4ABB
MGKLDDLKKSGQIGASFGAGVAPGSTPAGMDLGRAMGVPARLQGIAKDKDAALIPVDRIVRDEAQPREEFDEDALGRLAESLRTRGQLQPIRVRWDEGRGAYVVIMGERRWRAASMAGLATLRCVVQEIPETPEELLALQLVENALREDLKPIEQAKAYRRLMDAHGWSGSQVARELSVDQSVVSRALSLLELPEAVQAQVDAGTLAVRSAAEIARIDDPETQRKLAQAAVSEGLKRDEVAELVQAVKARRPAPMARPSPVAFNLGDASVRISWKKAGNSAVQVLRRALKEAQERERQGHGEVDAA